MLTKIQFDDFKPDYARTAPWKASVDRIDPKKGYVKGNVRLVCSAVNSAMMDFGEPVLYVIAEALLQRR